MELQVGDALSTLLDARMSVRGEMERLARHQPLDRAAPGRRRETVHCYADQADTLILAMVRQDAPDPLVAAVEEVFDTFRDAEGQIEAVIRRGGR